MQSKRHLQSRGGRKEGTAPAAHLAGGCAAHLAGRCSWGCLHNALLAAELLRLPGTGLLLLASEAGLLDKGLFIEVVLPHIVLDLQAAVHAVWAAEECRLHGAPCTVGKRMTQTMC